MTCKKIYILVWIFKIAKIALNFLNSKVIFLIIIFYLLIVLYLLRLTEYIYSEDLDKF
jgi:hypothetical protein